MVVRNVLPLRAVVVRTNCREGASAILGSHTTTGSERVRPAELFHATATATLGSKGLRTVSNNRLTCTADHLPPRAAGMPRSSNPAAMARSDS